MFERAQRMAQMGLIQLVRGYQLMVSPWLANHCRFNPTCSRYAIVAIERHGALYGGLLAVRRIMRCHPLNKGGDDPVPDARPPKRNQQ